MDAAVCEGLRLDPNLLARDSLEPTLRCCGVSEYSGLALLDGLVLRTFVLPTWNRPFAALDGLALDG
jgi:hypothetical protein